MIFNIPTTKSGKLEARIAEIEASNWPDYIKREVVQLAIENYETNQSVTAGGTYDPGVLSEGDYIQPHYPGYAETVNQRAMREDATDHS